MVGMAKQSNRFGRRDAFIAMACVGVFLAALLFAFHLADNKVSDIKRQFKEFDQRHQE